MTARQHRRVDVDELHGLLARRGLAVPDPQVHALVENSAGWRRLVVAVIDRLSAPAVGDDAVALGERGTAWLRSTWLPALDDDVREVLTLASLADAVAIGCLDHLHGRSTVDAIDELIDQGVARWADDRGRPESSVQLPPIVTEVLRSDLISDGRWKRLQASAMQWNLRREQYGAALHHAATAEEWEAASAIVARWWPELSYTGHRPLLQQVVMTMPERALRSHPGAMAVAEYLHRLPAGSTPDTMAPRPGGPSLHELLIGDRARVLLRQNVMAMVDRRLRGRMTEAVALAEQALPLVDAARRARHSRTTRYLAMWWLQAGVTQLLAGRWSGARRAFHRSWDYREEDELGFVGRDAAFKVALLHAVAGEPDQSRRWLGLGVERPGGEDWIVDHVEAPRHGVGLLLATDSLDREGSREHAVALERSMLRQELWPILGWARLRHEVTFSDSHSALRNAEDLLWSHDQTATGDGLPRSAADLVLAEAFLAAGLGDRALELVVRSDPPSVLGRLILARLRLLSGSPDTALHVLDQQHTALAPRFRTEWLLLRATAADLLGDSEASHRDLAEATSLVGRNQDLRVLLTVPREFLDDHRSVDGLDELLAALDQHGLAPIYPPHLDLVDLTEREWVVLRELAADRTIEQIAQRLVVSVHTVKSQRRTLYQKLGAHDRQDAIARARMRGLLDRE